jgi:hypothetical protein
MTLSIFECPSYKKLPKLYPSSAQCSSRNTSSSSPISTLLFYPDNFSFDLPFWKGKL